MISVCGRASQSALVAFTCSLWMVGHIVGERFFFKGLLYYLFIYVCDCVCMHVGTRDVSCLMWMLGTPLLSSGITASALKC